MRNTADTAQIPVTAHVANIMFRCFRTGVTDTKGTSNEHFAATSVNTESISVAYKAYNILVSFRGVGDILAFQASMTVSFGRPICEFPII